MFRTYSILVLTALLACVHTGRAEDTRPFLEVDGMVLFDIESQDAKGDWRLKTTHPGYAGNGYYEWTGPDKFNSPGSGTIIYRFKISKAGNYWFRWRNWAAERTEKNDTWVRFPTGKDVPGEYPIDGWTKVYNNNPEVWSWSTKTKDNDPKMIKQYFRAGLHEFQISGRSQYHCVDRVAIYKYNEVVLNLTKAASGPESPREGDVIIVNWQLPIADRPAPHSLRQEVFTILGQKIVSGKLATGIYLAIPGNGTVSKRLLVK